MLDTQVLNSRIRTASLVPTPFACSLTDDGHDAAWVRLAGELDLATSPVLAQTLSVAQAGARLVVVDLRQVEFADSSALHALVRARERAQRECRRLVVLRGPPHVDRIFTLTGVGDAIEVVDLDAAAPPVMALLELAAGEGGSESADVGDDGRATG